MGYYDETEVSQDFTESALRRFIRGFGAALLIGTWAFAIGVAVTA